MTAPADPERLVEAVLFAAAEPVAADALEARLPEGVALGPVLAALTRRYAERGINLVQVAGGWAFRTAPDLAPALRDPAQVVRKPSRAAVETLAVIAYHQPVTRAEIETIRGVSTSKGTLDVLLEAGWIAPGRRRATPGRPLTWTTTPAFLDHFGLAGLDALPGLDELRASGLLDTRPAVTILPGGASAGADDPSEEEPG